VLLEEEDLHPGGQDLRRSDRQAAAMTTTSYSSFAFLRSRGMEWRMRIQDAGGGNRFDAQTMDTLFYG